MSEKISIIITTYRSYDKLKDCLQSIIEHTKFIDFKVYVMANDPDDRMKETIHNSMYINEVLFTDRIEVFYNDSNSGSFSSNNNELAKEALGEYLLFLNDDIVVKRDDWLYNMSLVLDKDKNAGIVGALLLYPDEVTIQHCGVFFSQRTNNLPFHMLYKKSAIENREYISKYRMYQVVTGACLLMRRSDFESVDGFSEDYFYSFEDVDLCLRVKDKLKKYCVYCPDSVLVHNEGISKTQPKLKDNIAALLKNCSGKYYNDLEFYLSNPNHMVYKKK